MDRQNSKEKPEVYALRQNGSGWQISRRDFLKAAGAGAAILGAGSLSRPAGADDKMAAICAASNSGNTHKERIVFLGQSPDRKYLISVDSGRTVKCWDMNTYERISVQRNMNIGDVSRFTVGDIDGKLCLLHNEDSSRIYWRELPELDRDTEHYVGLGISKNTISAITSDKESRIFAVREGEDYAVFRFERSEWDTYEDYEIIYSMDRRSGNIHGIAFLCDNGRKLFITTPDEENRLLDPVTGEDTHVNNLYLAPEAYAVLPDDRFILLCGRIKTPNAAEHSMFGLYSADENKFIWEQNVSWGPALEKLQGTTPKFTSAAVTPDGKYAVLLGIQNRQPVFWLIFLENGEILKRYAPKFGSSDHVLISEDGSKFAVASDKKIYFISIPDFQVLNCPVDPDEADSNTEYMQLSGTEPNDGKTVTFVMPKGAAIPEWAVCICNTVSGEPRSTPDPGVVIDSCLTNYCSCVGHVSTHYWHPN